ncbi:MAG: hypothetical protein K2U26_06340 [Cyclobacteriaceae bacterium]|nr:hypothetical protein [Cyclobacteriaceae bacterium]
MENKTLHKGWLLAGIAVAVIILLAALVHRPSLSAALPQDAKVPSKAQVSPSVLVHKLVRAVHGTARAIHR